MKPILNIIVKFLGIKPVILCDMYKTVYFFYKSKVNTLRFSHVFEAIIIYSVFILGKRKFKVILLKNSLN